MFSIWEIKRRKLVSLDRGGHFLWVSRLFQILRDLAIQGDDIDGYDSGKKEI
jgi:hypothetical protein